MKFTKYLKLFLFCSLLTPLVAEDPYLEIFPDEAELVVGDSLQFTAVYYDTNGVGQDTLAAWAVSPDTLGWITAAGWFYAGGEGECSVTASVDTLTAIALVTIEAAEDEEPGEEGSQLVILPNDSVAVIGTEVQFSAFYPDGSGGSGDPVDTTTVWELGGMPVGTLDENGLLSVESPGFGIITAIAGEHAGAAYIIAVDSTADTTGLNSITITRDSPNPNGYTVMDTLTEGEIWTIGGLPRPMNILNGGNVYFPMGSLTEDVRIHMALPGFFQVGGDTVEFGHDGIVNGVQFRVMTDDSTVVEPYYFETPLLVGLVFKRGLLNNLGIDPADLGLYFTIMQGDTLYFDETGIEYTTVDEYTNRIYSSVIHFSDLVVAVDPEGATDITSPAYFPEEFTLYQNFPNPFNPTTVIRYSLSTPDQITLSVYDVTGRLVSLLVEGYHEAGGYELQWDGTSSRGITQPAGVYLGRLQTSMGVQTIKMVYMK